MSHIRRYPSWQTLCLLLLYLCPAIAGSVLQARGLPEIVPPKPKVNEPEASIPGSGSAWKGGSLSEPEGYITSLDLSPADDVQEPLFSKPEKHTELAENVLDLLNSLIPSPSSTTASPGTITSLSVPAINPVTPMSEAILGCSIFSSYISLCAPSSTPSSHPGSAPASQASDAALASCACYSSTYYVSDALDSAASACAGYTSMYASAPNSALVPLATSAAQMEGFCASRNVRNYPSAQFGQVTPTASSGSSSSSDSATPSNDGDKLVTAKMSLWVALLACTVLF